MRNSYELLISLSGCKGNVSFPTLQFLKKKSSFSSKAIISPQAFYHH